MSTYFMCNNPQNLFDFSAVSKAYRIHDSGAFERDQAPVFLQLSKEIKQIETKL